ncbi:MAG: 4-hydroxy-tetrahydrodipicolinate reductase [Dehalococcoidia bacterium]|nr:4-hydroxy-tetrahydrodipicolinate reductase [Dehalococcoidia bacterium]
MDEIRVAVSGTGKMGRQVAEAINNTDDMRLVGYLDGLATEDTLDGLHVGTVPATFFSMIQADVVVDFTNAAWTPGLAQAALAEGVHLVIGTTGLGEDFTTWLEQECKERKTGAVLASNFAIGAVLMMHFAKQAARFFDSAEVIELHHDQKVDSPSGTAKTTAELMRAAREDAFNYRTSEKETLLDRRAGPSTEASPSIRCGCRGWWRTRKCCSAAWGRR